MTVLAWTEGSWPVRVHQSGGCQSVTFDLQATASDHVYSIKQQGHSWVVIRTVDGIDDRYHVSDSVQAAKRKAQEWEQPMRSEVRRTVPGRRGRPVWE